MPFDMPTADRARLNELLNVLGDRAEDFRKCFDAESEWCWKYADLMLRGMQQRELEYAERHHVVPACLYGKRNSTVNEGNLTTLTYGEHLYAHYCAALCGVGQMKGKMSMAFRLMYNVGIKNAKPILPEEQEFIESIPEREVIKVRSMDPRVIQVDTEGRTHTWEDPTQYQKDYRKVNRERISAYKKVYHQVNKDQRALYAKKYREINKEQILDREKEYRNSHKNMISLRNKNYWKENKEKLSVHNKEYRETHKEQISAKIKEYRETHKEQISARRKAQYDANKEKIIAKAKKYRITNRDRINHKVKLKYEAKKAAGYLYRKDPVTGKRRWVFVGLPGTPESLCA